MHDLYKFGRTHLEITRGRMSKYIFCKRERELTRRGNERQRKRERTRERESERERERERDRETETETERGRENERENKRERKITGHDHRAWLRRWPSTERK